MACHPLPTKVYSFSTTAYGLIIHLEWKNIQSYAYTTSVNAKWNLRLKIYMWKVIRVSFASILHLTFFCFSITINTVGFVSCVQYLQASNGLLPLLQLQLFLIYFVKLTYLCWYRNILSENVYSLPKTIKTEAEKTHPEPKHAHLKALWQMKWLTKQSDDQ